MKYYLNKSDRFALRLRLFAVIFVIFASICMSTNIYAQNIRGLLMRGPLPVGGVPVNVLSPTRGPSGFSYSRQDGMYYLFNIPTGRYILQVWDIPNRPPMQFRIIVYPQQWVDIAPIQVR